MTYYVLGALEDSCMVDSYAMVWKRDRALCSGGVRG
jgi:hypothetical protein